MVRLHFACILVIDVAIGAAIGVVTTPNGTWHPWSPLHCLLEVMSAIVGFWALWKADIKLADPDLGTGKATAEILSIGFLLIPLCGFVYSAVGAFAAHLWACSAAMTCVLASLALRGRSLIALGVLYGVVLSSLQHVDQFKDSSPISPDGMKLMVMCLVAARTEYVQDQRLAVCIIAQPLLLAEVINAIRLSAVERSLFMTISMSFFLALIYANMLLRRRKRHLPPGLAKCKFVRLGYLRKLQRQGRCIQRCQDLPDEAFGDPHKALHLIILSHRWLDPLRCDVASEGSPQGLKLDRLLLRLEAHFSPPTMRGQCFDRPHRGILGRLASAYASYAIGGSDVLIFFDFMSIPQDGLKDDGGVAYRSKEDQAIFDECIPNMGALYSIFPVLVLPDVPEGDCAHNYTESGWCTCELMISTLGDRLHPYSVNTLDHFLTDVSRTYSGKLGALSQKSARRLSECIKADLTIKSFFYDSDRHVALGIIDGFLTKRLLVDSIRGHAYVETCEFLSKLNGEVRQAMLDSPIDDDLNTLLHLAVMVRSVGITSHLLRLGARPTLRNIRGDLPSQWYLFPRCGGAAQLSRSEARRQRLRVFRHDTSCVSESDESGTESSEEFSSNLSE